jgi:hypothetical protein
MAAFVYNHDVAGLQRRINRFIEEFAKSQSSPWSEVLAHDFNRAKSYLNALRAYKAWVVAQPQLDLPETHPRQHVLEENPAIPEIENESVRDLVVLFELLRDELINGQSARIGSGLIAFDAIRFDAVVTKTEAFLDDYVAPATPLDLPETSPMKAITPPGATGV